MLDISFLNQLSRLRISLGQKSSMQLSGNRKSLQKGSSTEFSDFREYMPGDDIRRIDWNAYGRLDKFYIKEYMEEKEALITILLDTSASMRYGESPKSELLQKLALSLSFIALNNLDRVRIIDCKRPEKPFTASGGKRALPRLLDFLNRLDFEESVCLTEVVPKLGFAGPGVTIVISDFLQEELLEPGGGELVRLLRFLQYKKQHVILLQTLAKEELSIDICGTYNLIDMENASRIRLTLEQKSITLYENALKAFQKTLRTEALRVGGAYCLCRTDMDFQQLILQELRFVYDI